MIYVIGSGPAGVACAEALLEQGLEVAMIDAGYELEPEPRQAVDRLRVTNPTDWRGDAVEFLKRNVAPDRKGVGLKYAFGSDFPYRGTEEIASIKKKEADLTFSLAKGGFSNVWGSAILPYRASDITDWPITLDELAPHYTGVLKAMNIAASRDDLEQLFPLYTSRPQPLRCSRQSQAFLRDLAANRDRLRSSGIYFGSSRLAVRAQPDPSGPGCVSCGLCMYGCPNDAIYNSASRISAMQKKERLHYIPGMIVRRLEESGTTVRIHATRIGTENAVSFSAERVYVACGPLSSTRLLLESFDAFDHTLTLRDSCYFLFPLARFMGVSGVSTEPLHTLSQVFMEIVDAEISSRTVHLQIYTYNDLVLGAMKKSFGPAYPMVKPLASAMLSRLLIVQGYLHSDESPSIGVSLSRVGSGDKRELNMTGRSADAPTAAILNRLLKKLSRNWSSLKAIPLKPLLHRPLPGRGFHSGGSFPMSGQPRAFESDVLGRPHGLKRVHVVDSTVLPSIPATTITFSVMANARRIASRHAEL